MIEPGPLLRRIDAVERYIPAAPWQSDYLREAAVVTRRAAETEGTLAWVYFCARPLDGAVWIPSGDYRRHVGRRGVTLL